MIRRSEEVAVSDAVAAYTNLIARNFEIAPSFNNFYSDHGEMLGDLDTYQKFLPYDASCRIPMLLRWPGHIEAGSRRSDFVDLNDLLPTFLDAAGTTYPGKEELPGESLFAREPQKDRTVQYVEHQRESKRWCCLVGQRYKYHVFQ